MKQLINSRRAMSAGGAALILVVIVMFGFVGYIGYREGWFGRATTSPTQFSYYDADLGQTLYFPTRAELDAYVAKKGLSGGGSFPISGKVLCLDNGTAVTSATVEIYAPPTTADGFWQMKDSCTTSATDGSFTTVTAFAVGSRIMIHVQRSATKYIYDKWQETVVPQKGKDITSSPIGTIEVPTYCRATPTVTLHLGNGTAVSTTVATPTPLSKANGGATQTGAYAQLNIGSESWAVFGLDPFTQPATSKGHEKLDYVTVITVAFNVTGISWQGTNYNKVSVSSGAK